MIEQIFSFVGQLCDEDVEIISHKDGAITHVRGSYGPSAADLKQTNVLCRTMSLHYETARPCYECKTPQSQMTNAFSPSHYDLKSCQDRMQCTSKVSSIQDWSQKFGYKPVVASEVALDRVMSGI